LVCILVADNIVVDESEIIKISGATSKNGTDPDGVYKVLKQYKVPYRAGRITIQQIYDAIDNDHPVLLMLQAYRDNPKTSYRDCWNDGHGVVCIGYDANKFIFEDPASPTRTWLDDASLSERWHDTNASGDKLINWGCEILRKPNFKPGRSVPMESRGIHAII
jgi:ABC-type bacteriocin/lantibiotic exporter with double-glycine peptidase domain